MARLAIESGINTPIATTIKYLILRYFKMSQNNTSITIGNITIHQSENGLYRMVDFWSASGKEPRHNPKSFFKLENIKELEREIFKGGEFATFKITTRGKYGGIYVSRELIIAYATWVSPRFFLTVLQTFDQLQNATTTQELIDLKFQLDNVQLDLSYREPRDKNTLAVHLQVATSKLKPYFDYLVSIGELTRSFVPQPDKAIYQATEHSKHVIGQKGKTVLFEDTVKNIFPKQVSWIG